MSNDNDTTALASGNAFDVFKPADSADTSVRKRAKNWISRGRLIAPLSKEVRAGTAAVDDFVFGDAEQGNVGKETMVLILARRDHAIYIKDNKAEIESYDRSEDEYQRILEMVQERVSGAAEGYDFLVWVPALSEFFTYHVAKTAMDFAPEWQAAMPRPDNHPDGACGPIPAVLYNSLHPRSNKGKNPHEWSTPRIRLEPEAEITTLPTPEQSAKAAGLFASPEPQGRADAKDGEGGGGGAAKAKAGGRASKK